MSLLTNSDLAAVLEAVIILNSDVDPSTLPGRSLQSVLSLIPNEMTAFDGFDDEGYYDGSLWYSPPGTVPLERIELFGQLVHEHPCFHLLVRAENEITTRTSDAMPLRKFHQTTLFNEFYRIFEGEAQMSGAMRLGPTALVTCSIHRPTLDFSDEEFAKWSLLVPHIKAAFRNARFVDQIDRERRYLGASTTKGIIALGKDGQVRFESEIARGLVGKYFKTVRSVNGLPLEVSEFINDQRLKAFGVEYFRPDEVLTVSGSNDELKISLAFDAREREILIFLEEFHVYSVEDFERTGVTRREAEILFWISRGKTDPQIAEILSVSPRTVHKHLEHIFSKFGVETRTAAVMHSLDSRGA